MSLKDFFDTLLLKWMIKSKRLGPRVEGQSLAMKIMGDALQVSCGKKFVKLTAFESKDFLTQQLILTELVVAATVELKLGLEDYIPLLQPEEKPFWHDVLGTLDEGVYDFVRFSHVPEEQLKLWRKMYHYRIKEYRSHEIETVEVLREKRILATHPVARQTQVRISTIALGALMHILQGKMPADESFYEYLVRCLSRWDQTLFKRLGLRQREIM